MKKVVVKIGSSVLAPQGKVDGAFLERLVEDVLFLKKQGIAVILVSSGAIACGLNKLGYTSKPKDTHSLMAIAALGQIILMDIYEAAFARSGALCAQILLTWDDFNDRKRYLNARNTLEKLLSLGVIPIINENDTVSSEEIRFGDNDRLSALVSDLVSAELLVILSNVEGLYSPEGFIGVVEKIDAKIMGYARKEDGVFTCGGMVTKLEAAKIAAQSGIRTVIAHGKDEKVIRRLVNGDSLGTVFLPVRAAGKARKRWIAFGRKIKGNVTVDQGAKQALLSQGKSLLVVGVKKVTGQFVCGDCVEVFDDKQTPIGRGLVNYSHHDLHNTGERKFLKPFIHRDNFAKKEEE